MESAVAIISVSAIIFLAHLFGGLFDKTRIPDVLPLVLIGVLMGPVFHMVSPHDFGGVGSVFTSIALIIILFDCGIDLDLGMLSKAVAPALRLGLLTFAITVATTVLLAGYALKLSPIDGCILGCIAAAVSPPVVIPMLAKLSCSEHTRTTLILESTICEVLGIVSTLACVQIATAANVQPTVIVGGIIASFVLAAMIGVAAALLWSSVLKIIRRVENSIFCTPAFVCMVYATAELLGYSGPVAALVFGLVLGNVRDLKFLQKIPYLQNQAVTLTHQEKTFFAALVFFLKSLFFVYVGLSMQFDDKYLVVAALVLTVWTMLVRLIITRCSLPKSLGIYDLSISSVMVPKGLAAAVLASLVSQAGIASAPIIREVAFGVILFSISAVALMTFLIERGLATSFYNYIFAESAVVATAAATGDGTAAPAPTEPAPSQNTDSAVDPSPLANSDT
ncbi:MAG: cation:proton antiporter [Cyanobacteria bacterium SZAS LIN-2]|nr:cation:proton antiporter [Cyanobacteria bacterium SZAS LIN-3]MBS1995338.1 cation:proton antiporter [Cyanobacteria bacterium SZAS LIN-2]MBS2009732.1 cation:proton antiporter [Cyanobacteria bacterium SZAS TMP-1]